MEKILAYLAPGLSDAIIIDRIDILDSTVAHPMIRSCWQCSIEAMPMVPSEHYDFVVAQWLLEHVKDVDSAAHEFARVLRPGGRSCAAVPNPTAPEFILSRYTPYRLHHLLVAGASSPTPTHYAFRRVEELVSILRRAGLTTLVDDRVPCVGRYLHDRASALGRLRLGWLGKGYDRLLIRYGLRGLMGDVFLVAERTAATPHGRASSLEHEFG